MSRSNSRVQAVRRTLPPAEREARLILYSTSRRTVHAEPQDTAQVAADILTSSAPRLLEDPYPRIALDNRRRRAVKTTPSFLRSPELEPDADEMDWRSER